MPTEDAKSRLPARIGTRLRIWWRRRWGWYDCPACGTLVSVHWVKDWIHHPEEPPCFYFWQCVDCGARTPTRATRYMDEAAQGYGYPDFQAFAEEKYGHLIE